MSEAEQRKRKSPGKGKSKKNLAIIGPSGMLYHSTSIGCLKPQHRLRRSAIYLIEASWFEPFIALTIFVGCCRLAWESPLDPPGTLKQHILDVSDRVFLGIFTVEMLAKMLAYGIIGHKGAYLRDSWCQLDFVVVCSAWAPILGSLLGFHEVANLTALRSVRALRPLRTLQYVPGMPMLVASVFQTMRQLGSVAAILGLFYIVFGILGTGLFGGALHYTCEDRPFMGRQLLRDSAVAGGDVGMLPVPLPSAAPFSDHLDDGARGFGSRVPGRMLKGGGGGGGGDDHHLCSVNNPDSCADVGGSCVYHLEQPEAYGSDFDSVMNAAVVITQIITFDTWSASMYNLREAFSPHVWMYYVLAALLGGFFVVNLFLAVVFDEFMRCKATAAAEEELEAKSKERQLQEDAIAADAKAKKEEAERGGRGGAWLQEGGSSWLRPVVTSNAFLYTTLTLLMFNVVVMCLPHAGMSHGYERALDLIANGLTLGFIVEIVLRVIGVGPAEYFGDGWNQMDFFLVFVSAVDLILQSLTTIEGINVSSFRALRLLRVLRLLRMVQYWSGVYKIFSCLIAARKQVANIFILLFVFMTVFALLGMQLFGDACGREDGSRFHFDYFVPAMLTVLIIFSGGWVDPYEACYPEGGIVVARAYFMAALVLGFFVILNLFIAILLESLAEFEEEMDEEDEEEAAREEAAARELQARWRGKQCRNLLKMEKKIADAKREFGFKDAPHPVRIACRTIAFHPHFEMVIVVAIALSSVALALDNPRLEPGSPMARGLLVANYAFTGLFTFECVTKMLAYELFHPKNGYVMSPFNLLDLMIVVISLISLCPEMSSLSFLRLLRVLRPLRLLSRVPGMKVIFIFLYKSSGDVFNVAGVLFFCHTLFAVVGMELFMGSFAECNDSTVELQTQCGPAGAALAAQEAAWASAEANDPARRLLRGRLLKGGGGGGGGGDVVHVNFNDQLWLNPSWGSFDSFWDAMLLLFTAATGDGWEEFMFQGMDAVGPGVAPVRNDFSPASIFFILWLVLGAFTMMNLFVGSVVDNFIKVKTEEEGSATMTTEQKQWVNTVREAMQLGEKLAPEKPPRAPTDAIGKQCFMIVNSEPFDVGMTVVILLNVILMSIEYHGIERDAEFHAAYKLASSTFLGIYYVECILKLLGLGVGGYFASTWNRFDFFLVCVALLDQFAADLLAKILPIPPMLLRVIRVARIMRILRLLKRFKRLRDLVKTTILSFPSFLNVGSILGLVTFVYAVLGVQLFSFVMPGDELNEHRNFETFEKASLLLFQCLTGDGWSTLMRDTMVGPERGCDPDAAPTDCGSPSLAVPYFLSYMFIGTLVLLNIVVAVILEAFSALGDVNPELVSAADITDFGELWAQVWIESAAKTEPHALPSSMMQMNPQQLARTLFLQPPPLGLQGKATDIATALRFVEDLGLDWEAPAGHESGDEPTRVAFRDVVNALVRASFEDHLEVPPTPPAVPDGSNRAAKMVAPVVKQASADSLRATSPPPVAAPPTSLPQPTRLPPPAPSSSAAASSSASASFAGAKSQFVPPPPSQSVEPAKKPKPPGPPAGPPPKAKVARSTSEEETAPGSSDDDEEEEPAAQPQRAGSGRVGTPASAQTQRAARDPALPPLSEEHYDN